jgi:hypothetical protein
MSARSHNFLNVVERTKDVFASGEDAQSEDARRTLLQVRQQYDQVRHEAEQKNTRLQQLREAIRVADMAHSSHSEDGHAFKEETESLQQQLEETDERMKETQTLRKVYEHMLARMQKEQAILRQKMLKMEDHLGRKTREVRQKRNESERAKKEKVLHQRELDALEMDAELERDAFRSAQEVMDGELQRRKESNERRMAFESWRHEVALEAANEAFNTSAGRLRMLYAIEKLASNQLQKTTMEQVDRSQTTEDGFQKIREVTGLADVMDIVHKFLNREHEHDQLKSSVKDAEVHLEALRQEFDAVKGQTEGITFDEPGGAEGEIFKAREAAERELEKAMEEHQAARARLQKTTLQVEHMKRWTTRVGTLLNGVEDPVRVDSAADLTRFFTKLENTIRKFMDDVALQINKGKITRKALFEEARRELNRTNEMLTDPQFMSLNRRVLPPGDPRSASRQDDNGEDDPDTLFHEDRDAAKEKEAERVRNHQQQQVRQAKEEKEKKQQKRP